MKGIGRSNSSAQIIEACRLLFPGALVHQVFIEQLHQQNLKSAYRTLVKEYHPDSCPATFDMARQTELFRKVTAAYELLSAFIRERESLSAQQSFRPQTKPHVPSGYQRPNMQSPPHRDFRTRHDYGKMSRNPAEQYYSGPLPSIPLKTGLYLYYKSVVSYQAVVRAIMWQRDMRPPFGELASAWGLLDPYYISVIRSATDIPGTFGERAIQLGLMTESQVKLILMHQKTMQVPIGRYFVERGLLREYELSKYLRELSQHNREIARLRKLKTGEAS